MKELLKSFDKRDPWWWLALVVFLIVPGAWTIGVFFWLRDWYRRKFRK